MKVAIVTSNRFGLASDCLSVLHESKSCKVVCVILCSKTHHSRTNRWRNKLKKARQVGLPGALIGIYMRRFFEEGHRTADLEDVCQRLDVPFFVTPYTNSEQTAGLLRRFAPDLALSIGNGYIGQRIFNIPAHGMVNVHLERLPRYRNARGIIWPIFFLEHETGLTIHQVDKLIDGGAILYQETQPILFRRKLGGTIRETFESLMKRAPIAVRYVCENYARLAATAKPQECSSKFTTPTLKQFIRIVQNNRKLFAESKAAGS